MVISRDGGGFITIDSTGINLCIAAQLVERGVLTRIGRGKELKRWVSYIRWARWFRHGTTRRKALHVSERASVLIADIKKLELK